MKDKIKEICNKLNREQISVQVATEQLFDLYNVVGQGEQLCDKYNREKQLQILTDQAQELNLGYED